MPSPASARSRAPEIRVMGHVGLTPQSATKLGGFKAQGRTAVKAVQLYEDALALAGGRMLRRRPRSRAGSGRRGDHRGARDPDDRHRRRRGCDGQVLVWHDLLGLYEGMRRASSSSTQRSQRSSRPPSATTPRRCAAVRSPPNNTRIRSPKRSLRSSRKHSRRFARGVSSGARGPAPSGQHRHANRPPACASRLRDASPPSGRRY